MGNLIKTDGNSLVGLMHSKNGELSIPKPFERDIFLFEICVAGTSYIKNIDQIEPYLCIDDKVEFFREPDNKYDNKAIVIKTMDGAKIGYIPRQDNIIFARLMDAGKLLFGRVSSKEKKGDWLKIRMKVYLKD